MAKDEELEQWKESIFFFFGKRIKEIVYNNRKKCLCVVSCFTRKKDEKKKSFNYLIYGFLLFLPHISVGFYTIDFLRNFSLFFGCCCCVCTEESQFTIFSICLGRFHFYCLNQYHVYQKLLNQRIRVNKKEKKGEERKYYTYVILFKCYVHMQWPFSSL